MKLTKIYPTILKKELKYMYLLKSEKDDVVAEFHRHLPDGTFDLIINLGSPIYYFDNSGKIVKRPDVIFIGGYKKYFHLKYQTDIHLIGIIFKPGYASMFVKDRLDHIAGTFLPAEFVLGKEIHCLAERLFNTANHQKVGQLIESYLSRYISNDEGLYIPRIVGAMELISSSRGKVKVREIAREVCMSERNLRRIFSELTAYSPIELLRIIRTKHLTHFLKSGGSIQKAVRYLGYHDAAHIIHDFRLIGGLTPTEYINQMNRIDKQFFKISDYAYQP